MRLLLDECTPRRLAADFAPHEVEHVTDRGWAGVRNGDLLRRMADAGFVGLITSDANLGFQHVISRMPVFVVVIRARSNRITDLRPLVPKVLRAIATARPGQVVQVDV